MSREDGIWYQARDGRSSSMCSRTSPEPQRDFQLIERALEFKYAARRQKKLLVVDMVPRWKRIFLRLLRIEVVS